MSASHRGEAVVPGQARSSRRAIVAWTARFGTSTVIATVLPAGWLVREAAAQDDGVILIAGAAEIGASPGTAFARSAAAEAAAARGAARTRAAAALADADSGNGALTQSPVAFAAANPDEGAVAQSVVAVASASSQDDDAGAGESKAPAKVIAPAGRDGGGRRSRGGGGGRSGRSARVGRSGRTRNRRGRGGVGSLPSAGIGLEETKPLSALFATAAATAAVGATMLRNHAETEPATSHAVVGND